MKVRASLLTVVGLTVFSLGAQAQTNAAPEPAPAVAPSLSTNAAPEVSPGAVPANSTNAAPEAAPETAPAVFTNAAAETLAVATNDRPRVGALIPLIVMEDVALSEAIKNLARQAGLNYMLDPKVAYGQPGPDGKVTVQPSVTLRWENVTAEQALGALLGIYNLQMTADPKTTIARITPKDPAAPPPLITKIIQLKFADTTNIMANVQTALIDPKRSHVSADSRTSQLVVVATEAEVAQVDKLIERLDTPTKQVLIESRLVETSINPTTKKGIDWSGTLNAQNVTAGNNLQAPTATSLGSTLATPPRMLLDTAKGFNPSTAFINADGLSAVLSFLNTYADAKVLSSPRTVTLDNEMAHIQVSRMVPVFSVTAGTANTTGGSQVSYTNLGVFLRVTPRISANNFVNLKVQPEVSRVFDTVTRTVNGTTTQADEYDIRKLETRVLIPSGNTLVLGGMVQDDVTHTSTKVPLLGDIPGVGVLFRSNAKTRLKTNLIIFVTPTIVQPSDYQPTTTEFLKSPVPTTDSLDGDWSAFDSGLPAGTKMLNTDLKKGPATAAPKSPAASEDNDDAQK